MDSLAFNVMGLWSEWLWPVLMFVIGLGAVIFVHEAGHFLVAKAVGIKVERFALGFGPRILGFRRGETDYCINLLPLGGYVKMLGQEDFAKLEDGPSDPRAYCNKSVGARFAVIAAGVVMNVLFAAALFILLGMIGMSFAAPVVGETRPGWPAAETTIVWDDAPGRPAEEKGLQPGDRILSVEGKGLLLWLLGSEVNRFNRLLMLSALSDKDDVYKVTFEREVAGHRRIGRATMGVKGVDSPSGSGEKIFVFGIGAAADTVLNGLDGLRIDEPFQENDRVVAIDGREVRHNWDIEPIEDTLTGRPATVTVLRDGQRVDLVVKPFIIMRDIYFLKDGTVLRGRIIDVRREGEREVVVYRPGGDDSGERLIPAADLDYQIMDVLGLVPRLQAVGVAEDSPADKAGLQCGDVIVGYGDQGTPSYQHLRDISARFADKGTNMVVMRDGKTLDAVRIVPKGHEDAALIGLTLGVDEANLVPAAVRAGSPAARAGLRPGDRIEKVNGRKLTGWFDLLDALKTLEGGEVTLTYLRDGKEATAAFGTLDREAFDPGAYAFRIFGRGRPFKALMDPVKKLGPLEAVGWGVRETVDFLVQGYAQIRSLAKGSVSPKELAGPVGIANIAIRVGRDSVIRFVHFMAMISVFLAVVNFLPFPVVDGGHAVFLLIEKIRRKPLSVKVMNWVQGIGLVVLALVFIAVTWNDITRLLRELW